MRPAGKSDRSRTATLLADNKGPASLGEHHSTSNAPWHCASIGEDGSQGKDTQILATYEVVDHPRTTTSVRQEGRPPSRHRGQLGRG